MDASKPRPEPRPEPGERPDVRVEANRCPFCREGVEAEENVVCNGCLTRHHPACWSEGGSRCSSCGKTERLAPEADRESAALGGEAESKEATTRSARRRPWWRGEVLALAVVSLLLIVGVNVQTYVEESTPSVYSNENKIDQSPRVVLPALGSIKLDWLGASLEVSEIEDSRGYVWVSSDQGQVLAEGYVDASNSLEFKSEGHTYRLELEEVLEGTWVRQLALRLRSLDVSRSP